MSIPSPPYEDSASISTNEYSLPADTTSGVPTAQTTDGIYQIFIYISGLTTGDTFEIKIYEKVVSGGTQRLIDSFRRSDLQSPAIVIPALILLHGWDITIKKISGTDRTVEWSIRQIA